MLLRTRFDLALAQSVPSAGGPPPLLPPQVTPLPTGDQSLSLGQWLISGSVGISTFYDSNIYQSTTPPILHGPGFEMKPSLLADFNTGIYDTSIYGNIDSKIYPTLTRRTILSIDKPALCKNTRHCRTLYSLRKAIMPTRRTLPFC